MKLGVYWALQVGGEGLLKLCTSIILLGGIFQHFLLLVCWMWLSNNTPPGTFYVVIDGNHHLFLFTHLYPLSSIFFIIYLTKEKNQLPDGLLDVNKAEILKYIKKTQEKFTLIIVYDTIPDKISNFLFFYIYNIYIYT